MIDYVRDEHFDGDETIAEERIAIAEAEGRAGLAGLASDPGQQTAHRQARLCRAWHLRRAGRRRLRRLRLLAPPTEETDDA